MRTTVTLEPDVARLLNDQARRTRKSFKETLNAAVRVGLGRVWEAPATAEFTIEALPLRLRAGVDDRRFHSMLDELDTNAFIDKARANNRKKSRS